MESNELILRIKGDLERLLKSAIWLCACEVCLNFQKQDLEQRDWIGLRDFPNVDQCCDCPGSRLMRILTLFDPLTR